MRLLVKNLFNGKSMLIRCLLSFADVCVCLMGWYTRLSFHFYLFRDTYHVKWYIHELTDINIVIGKCSISMHTTISDAIYHYVWCFKWNRIFSYEPSSWRHTWLIDIMLCSKLNGITISSFILHESRSNVTGCSCAMYIIHYTTLVEWTRNEKKKTRKTENILFWVDYSQTVARKLHPWERFE